MLALEECLLVQESTLVGAGLGLSRGSKSDHHNDHGDGDHGDDVDDDDDDDHYDDRVGAVAWLTI